MLTVTQDPSNPDRLIVSQMVTLYLDKVAVTALTDEVTQAIREQARKDLTSNKSVRRAIAEAATKLLLQLLGCPESKENQ